MSHKCFSNQKWILTVYLLKLIDRVLSLVKDFQYESKQITDGIQIEHWTNFVKSLACSFALAIDDDHEIQDCNSSLMKCYNLDWNVSEECYQYVVSVARVWPVSESVYVQLSIQCHLSAGDGNIQTLSSPAREDSSSCLWFIVLTIFIWQQEINERRKG